MKKTILIIILLFSSLTNGQFWENPNQKPSMFGMRINRGHLLGDPFGLLLMSEGFGNKVFDLSGNGHDGTLFGSPNWVAGKFGSALDFDGAADYIETPLQDIRVWSGVTVVAWVYWNPVIDDEYTIISNYHSGDPFVSFQLDPDGANYNIRIAVGATAGVRAKVTTIGAGLKGAWHQVAATYDAASGDLQTYYDGYAPDAVTGTSGGWDASAVVEKLVIGRESNIGEYFKGIIDHLLLYNRALTASEIALLYREPFCFMEPNWGMELYGWMTAPAVGVGQFININMN